ncbi:MAG: PQQ-dependent sugar dehydrogenase [Bacteroidia bacterium]
MKNKPLLCAIFLLLTSTSLPAQLSLTTFASGFSGVTDIKNMGDNRIFIVTQNGYIRIVDTSGAVNPQPFLNINTIVTPGGGEQGLLGLAFSPTYATDGRFYVNYTDVSGNSHISRYQVSASNPDSADAASGETILFVTQPYSNHNGGDLRFGPDGYLYCAFGDGGSGGDPGNRAQNLQQYLGKILRINVGVPYGYSIPSDNPFFTNPNAYHEIWAYGVRNPWRNSFDRITHDYWIADVGQGDDEEINFQPAGDAGGENYGWRCYEGNSTYNTAGCGPISNYTFPVYAYGHANGNCSVTGGYVYRGAKYGAMFGKYFLADYCSGYITSVFPNATAGWDTTFEGNFNNNDFGAFGEDLNGELYIAGNSTGIIYKLTYNDCTPAAFISTQDTISYCGDSLVLSTPSGSGFFYAWYRDGVGVQASSNNTLIVTQSGNYYVYVLAPNGCNATSDSVYVSMLSAPPVSFTGLPSFMCINQGPLTLTGTPAGGIFSGNGITGSTFDPIAAGAGSHKITYSYVALSGCTATTYKVIAVDACVSIRENELLRDIKINPNPSNGKFSLEFTSMKNLKSEIKILNLFGQGCYQSPVETKIGKNIFQLNLKELSDGIYFLRIKTDQGYVTAKFVISR